MLFWDHSIWLTCNTSTYGWRRFDPHKATGSSHMCRGNIIILEDTAHDRNDIHTHGHAYVLQLFFPPCLCLCSLWRHLRAIPCSIITQSNLSLKSHGIAIFVQDVKTFSKMLLLMKLNNCYFVSTSTFTFKLNFYSQNNPGNNSQSPGSVQTRGKTSHSGHEQNTWLVCICYCDPHCFYHYGQEL